jgi:hypothetical protein
MDELAPQQEPWDLEQHLNGCLAGYQTDPSYGAAVYFALEALWGVAKDVEIRANAGALDQNELDPDWIIKPKTKLAIPWMWIRALATAWGRYKIADGPLGHAFGLEGRQGKRPIHEQLAHSLDDRAIARWIFTRIRRAKLAGDKYRIEDVIQEAAEKFGKSDVTVRRAWQRFGRRERQRGRK